MTGKGRLHPLDGLRGLAALGVVMLHVWIYTDAHVPGIPFWLDRGMGELRIGVLLFFVLSGFLLAQPWMAAARGERPPPRLGHYALRRLARIAPGYWLALAGTVLLMHGTGNGRDVALSDVPKFVVFLENVFPATRNQLDPPMWSLHVEVSFYVLLPLIGLALTRARRPLPVCAALIAAGLAFTSAGELRGWPPEVMWTLPSYLATFACGIAAAALTPRTQPPRWALGLVLALGFALVVANSVWHILGYGQLNRALHDLPAAVGFAGVLWALAQRPAGWLGSAPLRVLGTLSYGIYLWHYPVIYLLKMHLGFPDRFLPAMVRVIPLTFLLAIASWFLLERPILRATARTLKRRGARRRAPALAEA